MLTSDAAARAVRSYCRSFDARRLGSLLASNAQLDYFGRHVTGRHEIEMFVSQLPPTQHRLDVVDVASKTPRRVHDVEGDVAPLTGSNPIPFDPPTAAPSWDSDDNSTDVPMPQTPPRTPPRPMDEDGSPRTPNNPIPIPDDILNAPRPPKGKRTRLHLETEEKVAEMICVGEDVTWTEVVGRLNVSKEQDDADEVNSAGKNFKLRLGLTVVGKRVKVVGIVYFDMMSCRKKLSFPAD